MSNPINEAIESHISCCYNEDKEEVKGVIDSGNSFVCKKCKEVIVNYF